MENTLTQQQGDALARLMQTHKAGMGALDRLADFRGEFTERHAELCSETFTSMYEALKAAEAALEV